MYTRKQFAELAGIEKSELYYYEKRGLLLPDAITPKGYRYYSEDSLVLYRQIQKLKFVGYSLDEIQTHMNGDDGLSDEEFYEKREIILKTKLQLLNEMRSCEIIKSIDSKKLYLKPIAKKERN